MDKSPHSHARKEDEERKRRCRRVCVYREVLALGGSVGDIGLGRVFPIFYGVGTTILSHWLKSP